MGTLGAGRRGPVARFARPQDATPPGGPPGAPILLRCWRIFRPHSDGGRRAGPVRWVERAGSWRLGGGRVVITTPEEPVIDLVTYTCADGKLTGGGAYPGGPHRPRGRPLPDVRADDASGPSAP